MPTARKQFVHTVRSQFLGGRMRDLRQLRGLSLKYVAAYLGVEESTLGRYERADWPFRRDHVTALLDTYALTDDAERAQLVELAGQAWQINQWQQIDNRYPDTTTSGGTGVDDWWVQDRASELYMYGHLLVPQAVQIRDYAQAVIGHTAQQEMWVDKLVGRVLERQQALEDKKPPTRLEILLEESVLHRPIGGRLVLEQQLRHLTQLAGQRPHVKIRVLPTRLGWHPGLDGAFTVCAMQRPYPPVALVHHLDGRLIIEADDAERYSHTFDKLRENALSPAESFALINTLADEIYANTPAA